MGGGYYCRPMVDTRSAGITYSVAADAVFNQTRNADPACDPKDRQLECSTEDAIIVAIDVTGSMGAFPRIIFDKLPMFYGQIMMQGYLSNVSVSFAGIGDVDSDRAPLQITNFAQGSEIDDQISKIWVEGGGGDAPESYEYAAYYFASKIKYQGLRDKAILFITGDEVFKTIENTKLKNLLGDDLKKAPTNEEIFAVLRQRYHIFFLCRTREVRGKIPNHVMQAWAPMIGEDRILPLDDAKSVVDVMLGCIALISKQRDLDGYLADMREREQTNDRIEEVTRALKRVRV